jgi:nucleosome binding factor SPN SPT16 subunit
VEDWLNSIIADIAAGKLLSADYYRNLDCDSLLDARDSDSRFDAEWMRIFNEAKRRWSEADVADGLRNLLEIIRRESFMTVSHATHQHEIASHVSDDFELIVQGRVLGMEDKLLKQLWAKYEGGEFPSPPFPE